MTAPGSRIVPMLGAPLVAIVIAALCAQALFAGGTREGEPAVEIADSEGVEPGVAATPGATGEALSGISGTLVNSDGSIASGVRIYICNDFVCVPTMSDEEGAFAFDGIPAGTYLVKPQASDGPPVASVVLRPGERLVLEAPITLPRRSPD